MSPREKKLLIFFATAGFLVLNFLAIGFYKTKRLQVDRDLAQANQKLETARIYRASSEQVADQMEWLAKHEPERSGPRRGAERAKNWSRAGHNGFLLGCHQTHPKQSHDDPPHQS